jgi:hypothetical protein
LEVAHDGRYGLPVFVFWQLDRHRHPPCISDLVDY